MEVMLQIRPGDFRNSWKQFFGSVFYMYIHGNPNRTYFSFKLNIFSYLSVLFQILMYKLMYHIITEHLKQQYSDDYL